MIRARIKNGWFIFGFTKADIHAMREGACLKIDLAKDGGKDTILIVLGEDAEEIYATLEQMTGEKLPDVIVPKDGG